MLFKMMSYALAMIMLLVSPVDATCKSTIFGTPGDKWAGGNALLLGRPVNATDLGIAHRTRPLGSLVAVCHRRNDDCVVVPVIDRGPYGAVHDGTWVLKRRRKDPGKWRGCADLTPATAEAIGHRGFDTVDLRWL